jgi:hypothetical protein
MNMKKFIVILSIVLPFLSNGQNLEDLFQKSDTKITWLGIDFSHVKLIGDFNHFAEWGAQGPASIRNNYFPEWNDLVYEEYKKYDVAGMLRKENMALNTDYIYGLNKKAPLEEMESKSDPGYTKEDIQKFVANYEFNTKEGLGILFVAESMNKYKEYAKYHFIVINMSDNKILLHELFTSQAGGIGLRNYWARTFFNTIKQIREHTYFEWKKEIISKK